MKNTGSLSRLSEQRSAAIIQRIRLGACAAILMATGAAIAQNPTTANPLPQPESKMATPAGYAIHQSVDLGGRIAGISGSNEMYDTLVNLQSGPRVLGETFEMHALPGNQHTLIDSLTAIGSGFGGDPNSFTKLDFSKGKIYEFSGNVVATGSTSTTTCLETRISLEDKRLQSDPRMRQPARSFGRRSSNRHSCSTPCAA